MEPACPQISVGKGVGKAWAKRIETEREGAWAERGKCRTISENLDEWKRSTYERTAGHALR
eukprot:6209457-Pleurochrysis_carterae.AAC.1